MQINYIKNAMVPNLTLKIRTKYEHVPFSLEEYLGGSGLLFKLHTKDPPPPI
jgi:hypothetical protein